MPKCGDCKWFEHCTTPTHPAGRCLIPLPFWVLDVPEVDPQDNWVMADDDYNCPAFTAKDEERNAE